ncbi:DUF4340 domain-containing protein [Microcoleus sp. FACHB-53]|nr:DUF4340 domain-containing protein [Microcoleus sp. FACHB-53]
MKLQRTTLVLLITATLLGGAVYYSEIQRTQNQEATKTTKEPIFSFKEDQIQSVTLYTAQETLEFDRVNGKTTNWQMKQPKEAPASDAAVAFLLNLLAEGKSDRSFFVPTKERQEYGFDQPFATVKVQLNNKQNHRLILGKPDFNRSFMYAHVDSSPQSPDQLKVLLVPIDFEYAVNRPISEWQSQSEKPKSPKPSPTSATPKLSPSATPSPKPSSTTPSAKPSSSATPSPKPSTTPSAKPSSSVTPSPKPSSATASPKPSPSGEKPKPSPSAASTPKPSPTTPTPKPSSTTPSPKPSSTTPSPKPSASTASPKPSPSVEKPKSSPTTPSPKPSPSAEKPKPSATTASPKPSPSAEKPKPSPT